MKVSCLIAKPRGFGRKPFVGKLVVIMIHTLIVIIINTLFFLQKVVVNGFEIPKGYSVAYLTRNANMDPSAFKEPEKFLPERWEAT